MSVCAPASSTTVIVFLEALLMTKQKEMGRDGTRLVFVLCMTQLTPLPLQAGSLHKAQQRIVMPEWHALSRDLEDLTGLT